MPGREKQAGYPGDLQPLGRGAGDWAQEGRGVSCWARGWGWGYSASLQCPVVPVTFLLTPISSCSPQSIPEVLCEVESWDLGRFRLFRKRELLIQTSSLRRSPGPCPRSSLPVRLSHCPCLSLHSLKHQAWVVVIKVVTIAKCLLWALHHDLLFTCIYVNSLIQSSQELCEGSTDIMPILGIKN